MSAKQNIITKNTLAIIKLLGTN